MQTIDPYNIHNQLKIYQHRLTTIDPTNQQRINAFITQKTINGVSKHRQTTYLRVLIPYAQYQQKDIDTINRQELCAYILHIDAQPWTAWTKATHYNVLKTYYRTTGKQELVKGMRTEPTISQRKQLSPSELITTEETAKAAKNDPNQRNKAILWTYYQSGIRLGEGAKMTIGSVSFDDKGATITIGGKTGSRQIRVFEEATRALRLWLSVHPQSEDPSAALWIGNTGHGNASKALHARSIYLVIRRMYRNAGIAKRAYPHLLRHSEATWMAPYLTEPLMRHRHGWSPTSNMPAVYVSVSARDCDEAVIEAQEKASARAKVKAAQS